ncbi:hypothetical protein N482_18175 [Pseudoalteromonas luteoviolacea NCIMB 1942]|uniref:Uncharacterized protein n=1 Tax=Pseudoalteromonas luteoviolacea NCIMB 1942 TaxID=1365253 RepID=A0A166Z5M6_9GAMM|nr:hypothetical protein N482_18175 [Pseudoalteromonas luteoviolacea NCIMB 1942]
MQAHDTLLTPLATNKTLKNQKNFPNLRALTVKALLLIVSLVANKPMQTSALTQDKNLH